MPLMNTDDHISEGECLEEQLMNEYVAQNQGNLDYLENAKANDTATAAFIKDVKAKLDVMHKMELKVIELESAYEDAKQKLEEYKAKVVVAAMVTAGVDSLRDDQGNQVRLESKFYCNPNKEKGRAEIEAWIKKMGGEHLLKHEGKVEGSQLESLKAHGIPFAEVNVVNTNSLKAFILDLLGERKGSKKQISLADIPEAIHFTVQQEVIIE